MNEVKVYPANFLLTLFDHFFKHQYLENRSVWQGLVSLVKLKCDNTNWGLAQTLKSSENLFFFSIPLPPLSSRFPGENNGLSHFGASSESAAGRFPVKH